jgi:hypothetical protein
MRMAKTGSRIGNVVVVGDVTLDWLEEAIARTERSTDPKNFELYNPGFRWTPVWGGAALLSRLTRSAIPDGANFEVVGPGLPPPNSGTARRYLESLALVKPIIASDGKKAAKSQPEQVPIRVEQFKGFSGRPRPAVATVPMAARVAPLACLVLDDAANGCRWSDAFLDRLEALVRRAPMIIVKLSRPLDSSKLLNVLVRRRRNRRTIVVINADDLRAQGVDISRRLSWERTATDLLSASDQSPVLRQLSRIGDVLVRLGSDACVVLPRKGTRHLVFDPRGAEDAYDHQLSGTMPGATSAFVAAVTARLLTEKRKNAPILGTVCYGLAASRKLLKDGFKRTYPAQQAESTTRFKKAADRSELDYPVKVFADEDGAEIFETIDLPRVNRRRDWSILLTRLRVAKRQVEQGHQQRTLPESIALDGPDIALRSVPTARYGELLVVDRREIEGYRSIENLLREYIKSMYSVTPRPLSIGVFGPPGSGKSFGIKQIARSIEGSQIKAHTFNLTQLQGPNDLVGAFHVARDEALRGCLPLLVFDEFDCTYNLQPWGWLQYFLAPMQDGEFKDQGFLHPLGHAIFVFAGGISTSFEKFSNPSRSHKDDFEKAKGRDFVSRLKGYVDVQGISSTRGDPACKARRAVLLRSFLDREDKGERTQNLFRVEDSSRRLQIDDAVLDAILSVEEYRHGARSLEAILAMSRLMGSDHFSAASLPSQQQLRLHVDSSFNGILREHAKRAGRTSQSRPAAGKLGGAPRVRMKSRSRTSKGRTK